MLVTVSTVKDTLPNIERFVRGNLAGGADHLFVFLDDDVPDVEEFLHAHPHVTCVRTDDAWWRGERPTKLNARQRVNANTLRVLLRGVEGVEWLFHIDADESIQVDRAVLDAVPAELRVVRLAPLEAVSRRSWDEDPTWFKHPLDSDDLTLLHTLGVLDRPHNADYFHGHLHGKSGVRPALDIWLTLHQGVDQDRKRLPSFEHESLRLLHYESFSCEEFVRKWTALLSAGPVAGFRPAREPTAVALRTLLAKGLAEDQLAPFLMRIFERTTEDDFDTLHGLGLLTEVDPRQGTHQPASLPGREQVEELLTRVAPEPKWVFGPGEPVSAASEVLSRVLEPGMLKARRYGSP